MNKLTLLLKHEFVQAIKKPAYIITTLFIPVAMLFSVGVIKLVEILNDANAKEALVIGYVDQAGFASQPMEEGLTRFVPYDSPQQAKAALVTDEISEYLIIPEDFLETGIVARFTLEKELFTPLATTQAIKSFLDLKLIQNRIPPETITRIISPFQIEVTRLDKDGEISDNQANLGNILITGVYAFLLTMTFQTASGALISGLGEEKESRLIEVLYSSVSVRQLMVGKILALGVAGLLQVVIWLVSAVLYLRFDAASAGILSQVQISGSFVALAVVYYLLGYLLFAAMSVTLGGITSSASEAHNFSMIYNLTCYVPIWLISVYINFPNSPAWVALSIFPITAPIQTLIRLGVGDVPAWQLGASLGAMALSVVGAIWFAEKVFRIFMLMTGKRLGLKGVIQGLREA